MEIVIIGAGKFGSKLTEHLSNEGHNITVIDEDPEVVQNIVNQYDVMGYSGNGASYETLLNASVNKADVVIATTGNDEINIISSMLAKKLGVNRIVARIRNPEYAKQSQIISEDFGIKMALNPDLETALEIFRILRFPSAIKVDTFANGKVDLVEIKIEEDSVLKDLSLSEIRTKFDVRILVCAVQRENEVFIPNGSFVLKEGDYVYLASDNKKIGATFRKLNIFKNKLTSAFIIGASKSAYYLAEILLENGVSVKIIDQDEEACKKLSELLPNALIINGNAINHKLLLEEGIDKADSVITLTGMDETNILLSSYAKTLNCDKVITKVSNTNYDVILNNVGLDSIISPKEIFANHVIKYVRSMENGEDNEIKTLYRLVNNKVEALEFYISKETEYTSTPIKDIKIKENNLLACIIRKNKVIIPSGNDTIEPGDSIIIITLDTKINDASDVLA